MCSVNITTLPENPNIMSYDIFLLKTWLRNHSNDILLSFYLIFKHDFTNKLHVLTLLFSLRILNDFENPFCRLSSLLEICVYNSNVTTDLINFWLRIDKRFQIGYLIIRKYFLILIFMRPFVFGTVNTL